jgi:hypothetical protein
MTTRSIFDHARRWVARKPSVEVHIPVSPTPTFFNMVQCLALSLRKFGGICRDAPIILTVGDGVIDPSIEAQYPWLKRLGVELRWVPEPFFREHSYYATGATRLMHDFRSDVVLLLDADILIAGDLDDLIRRAFREQHVAGMIAQASPLQFFDPPTTWQAIYDHCRIERPVDLHYEHPGWPYYRSSDPAYRQSPAYFNYGVIAAPSALIKQISESYFGYLQKLQEITETGLIAQIALTMSIVKLGLPIRALPVRYNFPNHPMIEALHGSEIPHAKILHLKETHQFEKFNLFADLANIHATTRRTDLRGINEIARQVLKAIEPDLVEATNPVHA